MNEFLRDLYDKYRTAALNKGGCLHENVTLRCHSKLHLVSGVQTESFSNRFG